MKNNMLKDVMCLLVLTYTLFFMAPMDASTKEQDWDKVLQKGYQLLSTGNTQEALVIFEAKVKKYPQSAACHTAEGRALKRLGKLDEAKAEFRSATQIDTNFADGFYELGCMLESDKDYAGAIKAFEHYQELKPAESLRLAIADRIRSCKSHL